MDELKSLYPEVREVLKSSILSYWPELRSVLRSLFEEPMIPEAILPLASCQAVNGDPHDAIHVSAAVVALGVLLRIFDDLADHDRIDELWGQVGKARVWNYASAVHTLSFEILCKAPLNSKVFHTLNRTFIDAFLYITAGQDRDIEGVTRSIEDYWLTVKMKTACAFELACKSGAIVGTNDTGLIQACGVFGHHLGFAIQIFNDMESIWQNKGQIDLKQGKFTLPLLYGLQFTHPEHDELLSIVTANKIATNAERIREILEHIDTKGFLIWAALKEREQARKAISICPNTDGKEVLESYITGMFGDINLLLKKENSTPIPRKIKR